jgi:Ca2+-binding RTX toxin-like protein
MFDEAEGLDAMAGVGLDPIFTDTGLTLQAKAITADGSAGDDALSGTSGDDVIAGRDGNDVLSGGAGNDLLLGGSGNNTFIGGSGSDRLIGGTGTDTADYSGETAAVQVDLNLGNATDSSGGTDTLISIERLLGSAFSDIIIGNDKENIIVGGGGADTLTGGAGRDTFAFNAMSDAGDTITDFTAGEDTIALLESAFGMGTTVAAGNNFSVIEGSYTGLNAGTNAAFGQGAPSLIFSIQDHALYFDANGAGEGYTVLATVQPGALIGAGDVQIFQTSPMG